MPKSKYPQQLDTSTELAPVRDNILEVGPDVINSLRSAIFNIERTLGLNPQGSVGNTVASRLDQSLDASGNIKSSALSLSNILTGPIIDSDVSRVASISESKLKLDFPTRLLQDEISILNTQFDSIIEKLDEISSSLAIHINPNSINRHPAAAISIKEYVEDSSDLATRALEATSVQGFIENIYDKHINYSGLNISSQNNSHAANQIYFDNSNTDGVLLSDNVQDGLEEIASLRFSTNTIHQDKMHGNGILKLDSIYDPSDSSLGNILAEDLSVSFSASTSTSSDYTVISISTTLSVTNLDIQKSDILTLEDSSSPAASYVGNHQIISYTTSGSNLSTVTIWGNFSEPSTLSTRAKISKSLVRSVNEASLISVTIPDPGLTSKRNIVVANPNATKVISKGIRPMEITSTSNSINVIINGTDTYLVDVYNTSAGTRQTIDTVVERFNEVCIANSYNFLAYRVDFSNGPSEIAIVYNIPDYVDERYTIKISDSGDGAIDALGFSYIADKEISSLFGSTYYINGLEYTGLKTKMDATGILFSSSQTILTSGVSGLNFNAENIKKNDILIITGAPSSSDNGSYLVENVSDSSIELSGVQLPTGFAGESTAESSTRFRVFANTASFENETFSSVGGTFGSTLYDVFLNEKQDILVDKVFEYSTSILSSPPYFTVVDYYGDLDELENVVTITDNTDYLTLSLNSGPEVSIYGSNNFFWLQSGNSNLSIKVYIPEVVSLATPTYSISLYSFSGFNKDFNLILSRVPYHNYSGSIGGSSSSRIVSKLERGNITYNEISTNAISKIQELPIADLRSNGVVYGLEITGQTTTDGFYSFDLSHGICYIKGKRIEIPEYENFVTDLAAAEIPPGYDRVFIAIDFDGNIIVEASTPSCSTPIEGELYCIIGILEFSGSTVYYIDARLFIDDLDLKLLNSITVSPQSGMAHFDDIGKAIKYAKRFSTIYPKAGIPTIHLKSGVYEIENIFDNSTSTYADWNAQTSAVLADEVIQKMIDVGLAIDFPVNIIGEGDSTDVRIRNNFIFSDADYTFKGSFVVVGGGYSDPLVIEKYTSGILRFSNFKLNNSRITMYDMNIVDGSDNLLFDIIIDNVTFDHTNYGFTLPAEYTDDILSISSLEVLDTSVNKGNLTVRGCTFIPSSGAIGSAIYFSNASRVKNISIVDNKLLNSGADGSLVNVNLYSLTLANSSSNIVMLGNSYRGSTSTSTLVRSNTFDGLKGWYDRISENLIVGRSIITGEVTFTDTKEVGQIYAFDKLKTSNEFLSATEQYNFDRVEFGTGLNKYYLTTIPITSASSFSVPLTNIINSCKVQGIIIGLKALGSNVNITMDLFRIPLDGGAKSLVKTLTVSGGTVIIPADQIASVLFNLSSYNIIPSNNYIYYVEVSHASASSINFCYVKLVHEFTTLSDALGL